MAMLFVPGWACLEGHFGRLRHFGSLSLCGFAFTNVALFKLENFYKATLIAVLHANNGMSVMISCYSSTSQT